MTVFSAENFNTRTGLDKIFRAADIDLEDRTYKIGIHEHKGYAKKWRF